MTTNKIVNQPGEKWAVIRGRRSAYGEKYAISNHGRLVKFTNDIKKGSLVKGSLQAGYPIWRYKENGEHRHVLIHLLYVDALPRGVSRRASGVGSLGRRSGAGGP